MDLLLDASTTGEKLLVMVVAIAIFVVVTGAILLAVDRPRRTPTWLTVAAFLGPAALMLGFGLVYPALRTIRASLYDADEEGFIGFANYAEIFTTDGFQLVLVNTAIWVLLVPVAATAIGLLYAVLVDRTRFEAFAKALVFLPMAISLVGASIIWRFVYAYRTDQPGVDQIGLANQILVWLGIEPYQFIITAPWNTLFLIVILIWIQAGFAVVILSAAIKAIPDEIVDAALLDGAGGSSMFRYITVPSIRPALVVVTTAIAITTLKVFDIVRTMTGGQFGTSVVANEFFTQAFQRFDFGIGAALAVILFVLVVPIVIYNVRQLRLAEDMR